MDRRLPLILAALAALLLGAAPARAAAGDAAADPAARWPATGSTLQSAVAIGAEHWAMTPCRGRVALRWTRLEGLNAQASWAYDGDPYARPSANTDCEIALSTAVDWDWVKLCSVVVHEVGHLTGHDHVDDLHDVMYPDYVEPVPACAATPEAAETGPAAIAPAAKKAKARKPRRKAPAPAAARRHRR